MTPKSFLLSQEIHDYLMSHSRALDKVERDLIDETEALGGVSRMQIAPEQGPLLTILARAVRARDAIELGTFTGFSALCIARGLPSDGTLICCDISEEWTAVARRYWKRAGVEARISLKIGPALETLSALPEAEQFDLAFLDADKPNYIAYYEALVPRMRSGGLVLVDNVLWSGRVADPTGFGETAALREFNDHVARDRRVEAVMLPVGDGLTVAIKNPQASTNPYAVT